MESPTRPPELWESCQALIAESRRIRAELDEAWRVHRNGRERVRGHGLSLLGEAKARLDARQFARVESARRAIDDLF
jgi:hypothetical protein